MHKNIYSSFEHSFSKIRNVASKGILHSILPAIYHYEKIVLPTLTIYTMTKVLMLIDNDLLSLGIISCLQNKAIEATFRQENTWESIQSTLLHSSFDLLIIDSYLTDFTHVTILDEIRLQHPSLKTILLGYEKHNPIMLAFLKKGIEGVCMKSTSQQDFLFAYTTVVNGKKFIDGSLTQYLFSELTEKSSVSKLSVRESQIANMLIQGMRTFDIANQLKLAPSTISTFKLHVYKKMGVQNIVDLANKLEQTHNQLHPV